MKDGILPWVERWKPPALLDGAPPPPSPAPALPWKGTVSKSGRNVGGIPPTTFAVALHAVLPARCACPFPCVLVHLKVLCCAKERVVCVNLTSFHINSFSVGFREQREAKQAETERQEMIRLQISLEEERQKRKAAAEIRVRQVKFAETKLIYLSWNSHGFC